MTPEENTKQKINDTVDLFVTYKNAWLNKIIEAETTRDFVVDSRKQWTDNQKAILDENNRIYIAINRLKKKAQQLVGLYLRNRKEIKVIATLDQDYKKADLNNKLLKYTTEVQNDFRQVQVKMFNEGNMMETGGYARIYYGYKDNEPQIIIDNINPLSILIDPETSRYDLTDCGGIFESEFYSIEMIKERYPDKADIIQEAHSRNSGPRGFFKEKSASVSTVFKNYAINHYSGDFQDRINNKYRVLVFNYPKYEKDDVYINKLDGKVYAHSSMQIEELAYIKKQIELEPAKWDQRRQNIKRYYIRACIPALDILLHDDPQPCHTGTFEYFRYAPYDMTTKLINNVAFFTDLIDVQKEYNKFRSTIIDILNKINNPKFFYKKGALDKDQKELFMKNEINTLEYKGMNPPELVQYKIDTFNFDNMMMQMIGDMDDISGINREMDGVSKSEDNASLFQQKLDQASNTLASVLYHMTETVYYMVKALLKMQQKYYTGPMDFSTAEIDDLDDERVYINIPMHDGQIYNDIRSKNIQPKMVDTNYSETTKLRNLSSIIKVVDMMRQDNETAAMIPWHLVFNNLDLGEDTKQWQQYIFDKMNAREESAEAAAEYQAAIQDIQMKMEARQKDLENKIKIMELKQKAVS